MFLPYNINYEVDLNFKPGELSFNVIEIDLINQCNLHCPLCFRAENNLKNSKQMCNIDNLKKFFEYASFHENFDIKVVRLIGVLSEPTLYPYLFELIEYLNSINISIQISTNGNLNNNKFWKTLSNILSKYEISKYNEILFAIEGSNQLIYEQYRVGGNLNKVIENMKLMNNAVYKLGVQFIYFNYNNDELQHIKQLMIDNDIRVNFYEIFHANDINEKDSIITPAPSILDGFYNKRKKINKQSSTLLSKENIICSSEYFNELFISVDEKIFPCTNLYENQNCDISILDNMLFDKLKIIINEKKFSECSLACSKLGHKLEQPFLRKRDII